MLYHFWPPRQSRLVGTERNLQRKADGYVHYLSCTKTGKTQAPQKRIKIHFFILNNMSEIPNFPSPDGRFALKTYINTMRMSHEVEVPYLVEYQAAEEKDLFECGGLWAVSDVRWSADSNTVEMQLHHYDNGLESYQLRLELPAHKAVLFKAGAVLFEGSFEAVGKKMEAY